MATYNSSSATSSYPLPHADNPLNVDVGRLRAALEVADAQIAARLPIASYTASDVMVKVKSLGGSGSGLDADTVDGLQAAAFAMASHTHADATTGASGFMPAADKTKLNGIGSGANVISVNAKTGAVTLAASDVGAATSGHAHADATTAVSGFMPAASLTKLNGIGSGANVISVNAKTGAVTLAASDVGAATSGHAHATATGGAAGFMAAADKTKLDGITAQTYVAVGGSYGSAYKTNCLTENAAIAASPAAFLEVRGTGGAAALTFHRPNEFAALIGIDSDNAWKVGGQSYGQNSYRLWHEGNDGSGSGLDADTVDGKHASAFAAAVHTHTGGQVPVVKSVQKCLFDFSGAGTGNVMISSVNTATSMVVMSCDHAGGASVYAEAYIQAATNVVVNATGAITLRFQVVEFY